MLDRPKEDVLKMRAAQPAKSSKKMNASKDTLVLVADDEPSTLALVASHVRSKGFDVIEASDGDQAWQLAHEHLPDLIILDVMMPGMSGWEVCRKVREAVSLAHTGVIMLTGIGENLNEMTSPLYGADTYIDKPFEFTDLDTKIEDTLNRRRSGALGRPEASHDEDVDQGWDEPDTMRGSNGAPKAQRGPTQPSPKAPSRRPKTAAATKSSKKTPAKTKPIAAPAKKASSPKKKARAASSRAAAAPGAKTPQTTGVGKSTKKKAKAPANKRTKVKGTFGKTKPTAAVTKKAATGAKKKAATGKKKAGKAPKKKKR